MLSGNSPEGLDDCRIQRVEVQVRPKGWLLDDLLLTLTDAGGSTFYAAISLRSNRQFGADSPPADFVDDAWRQFLHDGENTDVFNAQRDFLVLATSQLSPELHRQLHDLLTKSQTQMPADFEKTVALPHVGSTMK